MKPLHYLSILALSTTLFGCDKKENAPGFQYSVNNIHNLTVKKGESALLHVEVKHIGGTQKEITLSVKELPNPVLYHFTKTSGYPPFSTTITFTATSHTAPGVHPFKIVASVKDEEPKVFDVELKIEEAAE